MLNCQCPVLYSLQLGAVRLGSVAGLLSKSPSVMHALRSEWPFIIIIRGWLVIQPRLAPWGSLVVLCSPPPRACSHASPLTCPMPKVLVTKGLGPRYFCSPQASSIRTRAGASCYYCYYIQTCRPHYSLSQYFVLSKWPCLTTLSGETLCSNNEEGSPTATATATASHCYRSLPDHPVR